jgi:hypothetical protein
MSALAVHPPTYPSSVGLFKRHGGVVVSAGSFGCRQCTNSPIFIPSDHSTNYHMVVHKLLVLTAALAVATLVVVRVSVGCLVVVLAVVLVVAMVAGLVRLTKRRQHHHVFNQWCWTD